jgi:hypothetical protein
MIRFLFHMGLMGRHSSIELQSMNFVRFRVQQSWATCPIKIGALDARFCQTQSWKAPRMNIEVSEII